MNNTKLLLQLAAITVIFSFFSCMNARRIDRTISKYYGNTIPTKVRSTDYISFKVENSIAADRVSESAKTKNKLLPLLVFWKWDIAHTATINTMMPVANFTNEFIAQTNKSKLKEKLGDATIEVVVKDSPANFHVRDQGWIVYFLLYYVGGSKFYADPVNELLSIKYTVKYASGQTKTGELSTQNTNKQKAPKFFQSFKGMVAEYLTTSDANMKLMAKDLANKMIAEIVAE